VPGAPLGRGAARGPFPVSAVPGVGGDASEQAVEWVIGAPAAVRAAGIGVDVGADQSEHGGETDFVGVDAARAAARAASVAAVVPSKDVVSIPCHVDPMPQVEVGAGRVQLERPPHHLLDPADVARLTPLGHPTINLDGRYRTTS
jgi:hypothetical protein